MRKGRDNTDQDLCDSACCAGEEILGRLEGTATLGLDVDSSRIGHREVFGRGFSGMGLESCSRL